MKLAFTGTFLTLLIFSMPCLAKRKAPPAQMKGVVTVKKSADNKIESIVIQKKNATRALP